MLLQCLAERGILKQIAFKGGTSIRKMFIGSQGRFSTDLDFTSLARHDHEDIALGVMAAFEEPFHGVRFAIPDKSFLRGPVVGRYAERFVHGDGGCHPHDDVEQFFLRVFFEVSTKIARNVLFEPALHRRDDGVEHALDGLLLQALDGLLPHALELLREGLSEKRAVFDIERNSHFRDLRFQERLDVTHLAPNALQW